MSQTDKPTAILRTKRVVSAQPRQIFSMFEQPEKFAQWWGPNGFTNTFDLFEFKTGGRWILTMHGPDGTNYANEFRFRDIEPNNKIVIDHITPPIFSLTVLLTPQGDQTHLTWIQEFETPELADKLRAICEPANEQNLDRLQAVLAHERT